MSTGFAEPPPRGPLAPQLSRYLVSAILGLAFIATLTWWAGEEMRRSALNLRMTETSWQRRTTATAVFRDLRRADAQRLGFEMIGDAHFVANYRPARAQAEHDLRRLAKLCGGDKAQTARVSELRRLLGIKIAEMDAALRLPSRPGAPAAGSRGADGRDSASIDEIETIVRQIADAEHVALAASDRTEQVRHLGVARLIVMISLGAATGTILGCVLGWLNRRERHALAEQTHESLLRLGTLFACTSDALIILDPSGGIATLNASATRLLGYLPADVARRDISTLLNIGGGGGTFGQRIGIVEGTLPKPVLLDCQAVDAGGRIIPVDVSIAPMPLPDGLHLIVTVRDVSERKAAERMKDDFISTVSHELRTPLTSVVGALGLLRDGAGASLPERARTMIAIADTNARRLIRLTNDILDIDRLSSGALRIERDRVDLGPLVQRATLESAGLAAVRKVHLDTSVPEGDLVTSGDADRLLQVMANLLSNAIRFSPEGGRVGVAVERVGNDAVVSVVDAGPGVPDTFRPRLYERFVQGEAGSAIAGGAGLGLAISRAIIEAHGGTLWHDDTHTPGARFAFQVPLERALTGPPPGLVRICEDDPAVVEILRQTRS